MNNVLEIFAGKAINSATKDVKIFIVNQYPISYGMFTLWNCSKGIGYMVLNKTMVFTNLSLGNQGFMLHLDESQ